MSSLTLASGPDAARAAIDDPGSHRIGVGYRKDNRLISLTATRRKFRGIDYSDKDTAGVTVSVRDC